MSANLSLGYSNLVEPSTVSLRRGFAPSTMRQEQKATVSLTVEQADALLDRLAGDVGFRQLFLSDLSAAFAKLPGSPTAPTGIGPGECLRPTSLGCAGADRQRTRHPAAAADRRDQLHSASVRRLDSRTRCHFPRGTPARRV